VKTQGASQIEQWRNYLAYWERVAEQFQYHYDIADSVASKRRAREEMSRAKNAVRVAELQLAQLVSQKLGV
jgi:hypothetical protein